MSKGKGIRVLNLVMGFVLIASVSAIAEDIADSYKAWSAFRDKLKNDPGIVVYYTFEEGSGVELANMAANKKLTGRIDGATWVKGRWPEKTALKFSGPSFVEVGSDETLNFSGDFSIEMWVKIPKDCCPQGQGFLLSKAETDIRNTFWAPGYQMYIRHGTLWFILCPRGGQRRPLSIKTTHQVWDDSWHHVVGVFERGKEIKLYDNGVLASSNKLGEIWQEAWGPLGNKVSLFLGKDCNVHKEGKSRYYFRGLIGEVAVYNRALSEKEIIKHFEVGNPY